MAEITRYGPLHHFRGEANVHVTRYVKGRIRQAGRGLAFWFLPEGASIVEIPLDDRDTPFHFLGRSKDYQEVTVQGLMTWRVLDPEALRDRIDFTVRLTNGIYRGEPLDQIATLLVGRARQEAARYLAKSSVSTLLEAGLSPLQDRLDEILVKQAPLAGMGLEVAALRLSDLAPSAELDRALQTPTFEALQQQADQATFERRALAVEKERAIAENEMQNKIELAKRESLLIEQDDENLRNKAEGQVVAAQIAADGEAERIRAVEQARADMERARIDIYRDLPREVLLGLAAREFAGKLKTIEHLNITPDLMGTLLGNFAQAATKRLESAGEKGA